MSTSDVSNAVPYRREHRDPFDSLQRQWVDKVRDSRPEGNRELLASLTGEFTELLSVKDQASADTRAARMALNQAEAHEKDLTVKAEKLQLQIEYLVKHLGKKR